MSAFCYRYWDSLQAVFWPRFEHVFRLNIQSIRDCDPTKFSKEMGPHYVSFKYHHIRHRNSHVGVIFLAKKENDMAVIKA